MDRPHTEQAGDDVQAANDGAADQKGLSVFPKSVHADPASKQRRVESHERPHVAVKDERERLVEGDVLDIFAQSHSDWSSWSWISKLLCGLRARC